MVHSVGTTVCNVTAPGARKFSAANAPDSKTNNAARRWLEGRKAAATCMTLLLLQPASQWRRPELKCVKGHSRATML